MITNLVLADDAIILTEALKVLVLTLEPLHEDLKLLGLRYPSTYVWKLAGCNIRVCYARSWDIKMLQEFR